MSVEQKDTGTEKNEVILKDSLLMHNNMFWTSTLEFHLERVLNRAYADPEKKKRIQRWLNGAQSINIIIKQFDFPTDPLLIQIGPESWSAQVLDDGKSYTPDVELLSTHMGLVAMGDSLRGFVYGFLSGDFKLPLLFKSMRNHFYAMKIFF
jgi:hypothetical protein